MLGFRGEGGGAGLDAVDLGRLLDAGRRWSSGSSSLGWAEAAGKNWVGLPAVGEQDVEREGAKEDSEQGGLVGESARAATHPCS